MAISPTPARSRRVCRITSGYTVGALFAILLLNASLVGANAVGLATTYTLGDTFNRRHSLHWKITEAPLFYTGYAVLLTVSAAVSFRPDPVLGLLTQGVQALAGVLLPSATVFLVLLCNDRPVLGPWVNTTRTPSWCCCPWHLPRPPCSPT